MRRASSPQTTWLTVIAAATLLETWALRNSRHDATLSYLTRKAFATDTSSGRVAFVVSWAALTAWFVPHILNHDSESRDQP